MEKNLELNYFSYKNNETKDNKLNKTYKFKMN